MDIHEFLNGMSLVDRTQFYINNMRPVLNAQALFADGTQAYRAYENSGDRWHVRLRFRTARDNAEQVCVVTDRFSVPMNKAQSDKLFDYFEARLEYPDCGDRYHFEASCGKIHAYYNKKGALGAPSPFYDFTFRPQMHTPDWAKGAVFYQVFVDRFCDGDKSNNIIDGEYSYLHQRAWSEKDWYSYPRETDVCHFYGGDLQGLLDKLDYLQDLGVEVLYLNPVFVSPSNHKYDVQDYDYIDPHFAKIVEDGGSVLEWNDEDNSHAFRYITRVTSHRNLEASNSFFADFTAQVHKRGMKVILDGVFNHCGSYNKWMDRERIYENQPGYAPGAYLSAGSPYRSYFNFRSQNWPCNRDYDGWWGYETMPKLNYEASQQLRQEILRIGAKWVSPPYNADGWRLDVAADLGYSREFNHSFWREFRRTVKEANPDALILAENYSDPSEWLQGDQWDTVMNYQAFMEPLTWFLTGIDKHSDNVRPDLLNNFEAFSSAMEDNMSRMDYESLSCAMNELSNHDHSRFLTRTNGRTGRIQSLGPDAANAGVNKAVMREAVIFQMTWPGAPTVYYGDEAGLCGWTDPDNRRTYPWGREDQQLIEFHKAMISIHRESSALRTGSLKMLCGGTGFMAYGRFDQKERYITVINNLQENISLNIPVWLIGTDNGAVMEQLILSTGVSFTRTQSTCTVEDGHILLQLPARSGTVWREKEKE